MQSKLVYATRKSMLALAQARALMAQLKAAHPQLDVGELQVVTTGDQIQDRPLSEVGGKGLFVKEIEEALLEGRADCAVHSIKDVPAELLDGLRIACIPQRELPNDALVSPRFGALIDLPQRARVGTSSLRRALTLRRIRPDLQIFPLRGNVDTRLRKVDTGDFDAIVLAAAGLRRLGYESRINELLATDTFLPAIGQGALGVEVRSGDAGAQAIWESLHDADSSITVGVERGVMRALGGDCKTPLAAFAVRVDTKLRLRAWVSAVDGTGYRSCDDTAAWPSSAEEARKLGETLGAELRHASL
jgi:hydroxymethylbilane synthase